jgi:uncharacterized membrane protein YdjX (TVP38/TMEM64 family)
MQTAVPNGAGLHQIVTEVAVRAVIAPTAALGYPAPMLEGVAEYILHWFRAWGELTPLTALGLAAVFIVASFGVPRVLLNIGAGAVFGPWSIVIIQPSSTIGAVLAFLAARHVMADRVRRSLAGRPVLNAISRAIDSEGWRIVALLRLASPIPGPVANYAFGLTRIGLWPYTLATFICTLPLSLLQVYLGATGRAALVEDGWSSLKLGMTIAGLASFAIVMWLVSRRARAALQARQV